MASHTALALIAISALLSVASAQIHTGYGTAYSGPHNMDATGQNMCQFDPSSLTNQWQVYYGAMNQADWNAAGGSSGICGKCIRVRGVNGQTAPGFQIKNVIVKIVDQCPSWACDQGNVDFSTTALAAITGYSWDKKGIEWEYVDCNAAASSPDAFLTPAQKAARAAAAKRAAINAVVQKEKPTFAAEVNAALASVEQVAAAAAAAPAVTPEVSSLALVTDTPLNTAQQVVDEVATQAQQALQTVASSPSP